MLAVFGSLARWPDRPPARPPAREPYLTSACVRVCGAQRVARRWLSERKLTRARSVSAPATPAAGRLHRRRPSLQEEISAAAIVRAQAVARGWVARKHYDAMKREVLPKVRGRAPIWRAALCVGRGGRAALFGVPPEHLSVSYFRIFSIVICATPASHLDAT
jgi:hypothetical protein